MKVVVIVAGSIDHKYFGQLTHLHLRRQLIVHTGENPAAWGHMDRFALDEEITMWSSLRQDCLEKKGLHGESHTLRRQSVSLEAVSVALEPISFACHPGFLFLVQPYARNLPVPKLAQCHHHTPLQACSSKLCFS